MHHARHFITPSTAEEGGSGEVQTADASFQPKRLKRGTTSSGNTDDDAFDVDAAREARAAAKRERRAARLAAEGIVAPEAPVVTETPPVVPKDGKGAGEEKKRYILFVGMPQVIGVVPACNACSGNMPITVTEDDVRLHFNRCGGA